MLFQQHTLFKVLTSGEVMISETKHFTDTIFYQVELTARYTKMLGTQLFGKLGVGLTPEEFAALDTISAHSELCQRDIAKLILKDRANTGKLLDSLESKGFIERELKSKNNRPVKIVKITDKGTKVYKDTYEKLLPHHQVVKERIANTDLEKLGESLRELREILEDTIDIDI
ncbi:MAG: MarR family transcriptional regulator [Cyanobacteria bacterium SIG31]|nr:MarR family transcriptional regulator [Cyanobacteria bacterium SIG31]